MAALFGTVYVNTPFYKCFDVTSIESDAANTSTALTFAGGGMVNLAGAPQVWWMQDVTNGVVATAMNEIAINSITTFGFNVLKTSATPGVSAIRHTFRVYMIVKRSYEM